MVVFYRSEIIGIGSQAELFLQENMFVLFNEHALPELKDISIVHKGNELTNEIAVGDELVLDGHVFKITAVGDKVNETMKELGHCTVAFNGAEEADLPGTLCVEASSIPHINVSSTIQFQKPK